MLRCPMHVLVLEPGLFNYDHETDTYNCSNCEYRVNRVDDKWIFNSFANEMMLAHIYSHHEIQAEQAQKNYSCQIREGKRDLPSEDDEEFARLQCRIPFKSMASHFFDLNRDEDGSITCKWPQQNIDQMCGYQLKPSETLETCVAHIYDVHVDDAEEIQQEHEWKMTEHLLE